MKTLLLVLISFVALTGTVSGLIMMSDPGGVILNLPIGLLQDTPFKDFMIPGLLLFTIVGGVNLLAVFFNMQRNPNRYNWAMAAGISITGWIVVQLLLIGYGNLLHYLYLGIGILVFLLAYQLKGKWMA